MTNPFVASPKRPAPPAKAVLNYLIVVVVVVALFWVSLGMAGIALDFDFVWQYRQRIWDGFVLTVGLSAASLVASLVIGIPVAVGQGSRILAVRYLCDIYVKIIRGTPLLAQIYLFYYIARPRSWRVRASTCRACKRAACRAGLIRQPGRIPASSSPTAEGAPPLRRWRARRRKRSRF